jgi:hypothetical protein
MDETVRIGLWCPEHHELGISVGDIRNAISRRRKRIAAY